MTAPDLPASLQDAAPDLTLRIYSESDLGIRRTQLEALSAVSGMPAVRHVGGDVFVGVDFNVSDGDGVVPLSEANLAVWGVDTEGALSAVCDGLVGTDISGIGALGPGIYLIENEQFFAAGLLRPQLLSGLSVDGALTVFAASRLSGVVTGSASPVGIGAALQLAERLADADVPLVSVTALELDGETWIAPDIAARYPELEGAVALIGRELRTASYVRQAEVLREPDVFVAEAKLFQTPDGKPVSVATWTEDVPTLLPVVDEVVVVSEDGRMCKEAFLEFIERVSGVRTAHVPARFLVRPPRPAR